MRLNFLRMLSFLAGLTIMFATQLAYAKPITSARELLDRCRNEGSVALLRDLTYNDEGEWDEEEWDTVIDQIATGDPDWIYASGCLANGVYFSGNASAWLSLEVTWAELLAKAPEPVLRLEWSGVSLMKACGFPFIEPEAEFIDNHYQAVLAAFAKIDNEFLQDGKKRCEARLKEGYEQIVKRR